MYKISALIASVILQEEEKSVDKCLANDIEELLKLADQETLKACIEVKAWALEEVSMQSFPPMNPCSEIMLTQDLSYQPQVEFKMPIVVVLKDIP